MNSEPQTLITGCHSPSSLSFFSSSSSSASLPLAHRKRKYDEVFSEPNSRANSTPLKRIHSESTTAESEPRSNHYNLRHRATRTIETVSPVEKEEKVTSVRKSRANKSVRRKKQKKPMDQDKGETVKPSGFKSSSDFRFTYRTFPLTVSMQMKKMYPLWYRRFPVSSYYNGLESAPENPGGRFNDPRSPLDLYTPRFVQGTMQKKVGLCPICVEPRERGGEGKKVWLAMRVSAYNYHMQYSHGISASTGKPFSPPLEFRQVARPMVLKNERTTMKEGKCHTCRKWIALDGVRDTDAKVKEIFWWKHSAVCCGSSTVQETDLFEEDEVWKTVTALD